MLSPTRRNFIASGLAAAAAPHSQASDSPLTVDLRKLVARADLIYDKPAARSEEGIPIGNGRMGSLVWTSPGSLHLQINRADVYANSGRSNSFNERNKDYCGGCGFVDIDCAGGADPFPTSGFEQHLALYDGLLRIAGAGVTCRLLAWPDQDVMAIAIDTHEQASVSLRVLRYQSSSTGRPGGPPGVHASTVQTASHTATSQLHVRGTRIALTQEFREDDYCAKSAVVIALAGRTARAQIANETEARVSAAAGEGTLYVFIASAATFDAATDVLADAESRLDAAMGLGFPALEGQTASWWHRFWSRSFVHLTSADGEADFVARYYTYFLYLMGASSRGAFPPKFNGMLWNTGGDLRTWGAQHWFANLSCYYEAIPASNRYELMDPVFDMYSGLLGSAATAARQQWGSEGIYIPETTYFDGLEQLPEPIAAEMRELYLMRKPWDERSAEFREYARHKHPHSSRWNWIARADWKAGRLVEIDRGSGPFGPVNHNLATTAKIAYLFWRRYEYKLDRAWLRNRAWPMLRGAAELYRHFPNLRKEADGRYHIRFVNSNESVLGARDSDEDMAAMRGVLAAAMRASEILALEPDLRTAWRELLANLAPLATSDDSDALKPAGYSGPRVFVRGRTPAVKAAGLLPDGNSLPHWFFDLCNTEMPDREMLATANNTLTAALRGEPNRDTPVFLLSKLPMAAATMERAVAVGYLIPNQMRGLSLDRATGKPRLANLANRMSLREGPQALDAEALGRAAEALHLALLQSGPPAPGEQPLLRIFPACPPSWDAAFQLLARGAFLVTSARRGGAVEFVQLDSQAGARCRLRNPWGETGVTVYRDGRAAESLRGKVLDIPTRTGERVLLIPAGRDPSTLRRTL